LALEIEVFVSAVISFLIGVVATKKWWIKGINVFNEVVDVADKVREALEDDEVSADELKAILKEVRDVLKLLEG